MLADLDVTWIGSRTSQPKRSADRIIAQVAESILVVCSEVKLVLSPGHGSGVAAKSPPLMKVLMTSDPLVSASKACGQIGSREPPHGKPPPSR